MFNACNLQEAIRSWTACLELDPTNAGYNAKLHCNRANAHSKLRNHDAAIQDCGKAIELDPEFVKAYLRRAASLYALGGVENLEACIRDYEHAAEKVDEASANDIQKKVSYSPCTILLLLLFRDHTRTVIAHSCAKRRLH